MKSRLGKSGAVVAGVLGLVLAASAGTAVAAENPPKTKSPIVYRDPYPSTPVVRVDGSSRGVDDAVLTLTVLAPEHVGLTIKEQPILYWYQSRAVKTRFELTILQGEQEKPLVEVKLDNTPTDGIQRFRLSEHGIKLKEGVEYRWTVAMVIDPENRSKDIVASGVIKRVSASENLSNRLAKEPYDAAFIYADEGIWYDSLAALSEMIDTQPKAQKLHELRAIYFMQAGLKEAATFEMKLASAAR